LQQGGQEFKLLVFRRHHQCTLLVLGLDGGGHGILWGKVALQSRQTHLQMCDFRILPLHCKGMLVLLDAEQLLVLQDMCTVAFVLT